MCFFVANRFAVINSVGQFFFGCVRKKITFSNRPATTTFKPSSMSYSSVSSGSGENTAVSLLREPRVFYLDVLRGIAILLMLVVSIWEFGGFTANEQLRLRLAYTGGNYHLFNIVSILFEGKIRVLLAIVFGAGIVLFFSKKDTIGGVSLTDYFIRRQLWLILFGVFNSIVLLWPGDMLFHLGVSGILLFVFWRLPAKGLIIISMVFTLIYSGKKYWSYAEDKKSYAKFLAVKEVEKTFSKDSTERFLQDSLWVLTNKDSLQQVKVADSLAKLNQPDSLKKAAAETKKRELVNDSLRKEAAKDTLTKKQQDDKSAWEAKVKRLEYDSTADKASYSTIRTDYGDVWSNLLRLSQSREADWLYRNGIWDIGAMLLLGMALLKLGFFTGSFTTRRYLVAGFILLSIGLLMAWLRTHYHHVKLNDYAVYLDKYRLPADVLFPWERVVLALSYISFVLALLKAGLVKRWWRTMATVGRMALTNYLLQTLLCTLFFYGYGMGFFGRLSQWQLYLVVGEIWLLIIVFSVGWSRYYETGPAEWLWRRLVYRRKVPFKKKVDSNNPTATTQ